MKEIIQIFKNDKTGGKGEQVPENRIVTAPLFADVVCIVPSLTPVPSWLAVRRQDDCGVYLWVDPENGWNKVIGR